MEVLANAFNPRTVEGLMCRNTVNVAWDGRVYDCDFNAALEMQTWAGDKVVDVWSLGKWKSAVGGVLADL